MSKKTEMVHMFLIFIIYLHLKIIIFKFQKEEEKNYKIINAKDV